MVSMSIYRSRQPVTQYDHMDCLTQATGAADVDLLNVALNTGKPVLIGLSGESVIAKKVGNGDAHETYESLFDTCLTVVDLRNMQKAGVKNPDDVPPKVFLVRVQVIIPETTVFFEMKAEGRTHAEPAQAFTDLFRADPLFRECFFDSVCTRFSNEIRDIDLAYREIDVQEVEEKLPDGVQWQVFGEAEEVLGQSDDAEKLRGR